MPEAATKQSPFNSYMPEAATKQSPAFSCPFSAGAHAEKGHIYFSTVAPRRRLVSSRIDGKTEETILGLFLVNYPDLRLGFLPCGVSELSLFFGYFHPAQNGQFRPTLTWA